MITISTTDEDEARDLDEILTGIPWPYRIYLNGREFRPETAHHPDPRHVQARGILARSPQGLTARQLFLRLADEGQAVARQTVHGWLHQDEQAGLVVASQDRHGVRWSWRPCDKRRDQGQSAEAVT